MIRHDLWLRVYVLPLSQLGLIDLSRLSCFDEGRDEILLIFQRLMLESEPCRFNFALVIEDNVQRVLFSTDAVFLTALALNLDLSETLHLLIKRQF